MELEKTARSGALQVDLSDPNGVPVAVPDPFLAQFRRRCTQSRIAKCHVQQL